MTGQPITPEDLRNRFTYHPPPDPETTVKYEAIRATGLVLASLIVEHAPPGREASLAVTHVEEAVMWANAAIARATPTAAPPDRLAAHRRGESA